MSLPAFEPSVAAEILAALPRRVSGRVDVLAADVEQWPVTATDDDRVQVEVGDQTVTLALVGGAVRTAEAVTCSCLLAPRCAHRGAVARAAPITAPGDSGAMTQDVETENVETQNVETQDVETEDLTEDSAGHEAAQQGASTSQAATDSPSPGSTDENSPEGPGVGPAPTPSSRNRLSAAERRAVDAAWLALDVLLARGARFAGADGYAALLGAVHLLRAAELPAAASPFTAVAEQVRRLGAGTVEFSRPAFTIDAARALTALQVLDHADSNGEVGPDARGSARRRYTSVGSLSLRPVACEPVLSATGYAGVVVTLTDGSGGLWSVSRVLPSAGATPFNAVLGRYVTGAEFGGSAASPADLARNRVLVSGATASHDGRLGSGRTVRAVVGPIVAVTEAWADLPVWSDAAQPGLYTIETEVESCLDGELTLVGVGTITPSRAAELLDGRRQLDQVLLDAGAVRAVVRVPEAGGDPVLLAVAPGTDADWSLPEGLDGRFFPGLDQVQSTVLPGGAAAVPASAGGAPVQPGRRGSGRSGSGRKNSGRDTSTPAPASDPAAWPVAATGTVRDLLVRWLGRLLVAGRSAVLAGQETLEADARTLTRHAAPLAAELLTALLAAARAGSTRFDGTWGYDDRALTRAALRIGAYLVLDRD